MEEIIVKNGLTKIPETVYLDDMDFESEKQRENAEEKLEQEQKDCITGHILFESTAFYVTWFIKKKCFVAYLTGQNPFASLFEVAIPSNLPEYELILEAAKEEEKSRFSSKAPVKAFMAALGTLTKPQLFTLMKNLNEIGIREGKKEAAEKMKDIAEAYVNKIYRGLPEKDDD
jgi:hypothetical protein